MNDFVKIYRNKKVLVTGHTGFKGSWLSIWLKELGAQVIGYSLEPPTEPSNFEACGLQDMLIHIHGDVRDHKYLVSVFQKYQPEFVFHLAAQSLVRLSYVDPHNTYETNVMGTVNVMEAVRQTKSVRVVVNITSDKCYENKEWVWGYRENDPMGGYDPYSSSKGCAELITAAYRQSFFNPDRYEEHKVALSSVRAGNVIGGGDWGQDRLIPDCVRALSTNRPVGIRNPQAIRPWQHVLEPLGGYLWLGALLWESPQRYSGAWNFGPHDTDYLRVQEIVDRFISLWGSGTWEDRSTTHPLIDSTSQPFLHEVQILKLCCDKAHTDLKWRGTLPLDVCLRLTAEWYKLFYTEGRMDDMYDVCSYQIRDYTERASALELTWAA